MLAIWRGVESTRAQAAEAALCVDAASQGAVVVVLAFVDVFAALFVVRGMEAIVALAAIPRVGVDAAAVFAQARSQVALVRWHLLRRSVPFRGHIWQGVPQPRILDESLQQHSYLVSVTAS